MELLANNIHIWQERIAEASAKWGGAEICAVTKTRSAEEINPAWEAGIRTIGENRVQELMGKIDQLNPDFKIHLIGSLQTNKVKYIAQRIDMVQSVDRLSLAEEISRRAVEHGRVIPCLIQVNIAREPQKGGVSEEELPALVRQCAALPGVKIDGLMSIMPISADPGSLRPLFKQRRNWFDRLRDENIDNVSMNVLSMGMSDDCIIAAEEGATLVRLGRALFGARNS